MVKIDVKNSFSRVKCYLYESYDMTLVNFYHFLYRVDLLVESIAHNLVELPVEASVGNKRFLLQIYCRHNTISMER